MVKILKCPLPKFTKYDHVIKSYEHENIVNLRTDILDCLDKNKNVILMGQVQSGKTKNIIELTKHAFSEYKYDLVIVFSGNTNDLNNQTNERFATELPNVVFPSELKKHHNFIDLVITSLKQVDNIKKIYEFIYNNEHKLQKILIIDDECDFCGINTSKSEDECTAIYTGIYKNIYQYCEKNHVGGVIKLTATPFVNILSAKNTLEHKQEIFVLPTRSEYTGVKFFNRLKDFYFTRTDSQINNENKLILFGLSIWILSSYMLYIDKDVSNKKSDFLINIYHDNENQSNTLNIVKRYIKEKIFDIKQEIKNIINTIDKFSGLNSSDVDNFFKTQMENNISLGVYNQENDFKTTKYYNIYVGGALLSRGKTFENLLCELICIKNFNYDTLLQKCRWFGYRQNRSKYMALICNVEIKQQLLIAEKIIDFFHANNKGYQLDYNSVLQELQEKENEFKNANYTSHGKR